MGKSVRAEERRAKTASGPAGASPQVEISFPSRSEYLALVRSTARWFARQCRFGERDSARIVLAAVEATTNIIRHAYGGDPDQRITLRLTNLEGGIELEFLDQGKPADPAKLEERPPRDLKPGGLKPGGLGVFMMRTCMDDFCYEARPGGGGRLILRKLRGDNREDTGK